MKRSEFLCEFPVLLDLFVYFRFHVKSMENQKDRQTEKVQQVTAFVLIGSWALTTKPTFALALVQVAVIVIFIVSGLCLDSISECLQYKVGLWFLQIDRAEIMSLQRCRINGCVRCPASVSLCKFGTDCFPRNDLALSGVDTVHCFSPWRHTPVGMANFALRVSNSGSMTARHWYLS